MWGPPLGFQLIASPLVARLPLRAQVGRYLCRALAEVLVAVRLQQDRRNLVE